MLVGSEAPDTLESVTAQDYPGLVAIRSRFRTEDPSDYTLFVQPGVRLAPDAVSRLVEGATSSDATIVGPKLLSARRDRMLADVGGSVDRLGVYRPVAIDGEMDQGQHDVARDCLVAPTAVMLVRTSWYRHVGGFDQALGAPGNAVDLCWRVRLTGGRVRTIPVAVGTVEVAVGLDESSVGPPPTQPAAPPPDPAASHAVAELHRQRRSLNRGRLRTLIKCYGWVALAPSLVAAVFATALDVLLSLFRGRVREAYDHVSPWFWNGARTASLLETRRHLNSIRAVRDRVIAREQEGVLSWVWAELRRHVRGERPLGQRGANYAQLLSTSGPFIAMVGLLLLVIGFGSRHLITQGIAAFGQFMLLAEPSELVSAYASGWSQAGVGVAAVGSLAHVLLAAAGGLALAATGLARLVLILGLLPLGLLGMWRLLRPVSSRNSTYLALVLYGLNPLPFNALATGRWDVLGVYGTLPLVALLVLRISGMAPYRTERATAFAHAGRLCLLLAAVAAFEPLVLVLALALTLVVASVVALSTSAWALLDGQRPRFDVRFALRSFGQTALLPLAAVGAAVAVHLPWWLQFTGWQAVAVSALNEPVLGESLAFTEALRVSTGPLTATWLSWGLPVAAGLALLLARAGRAVWAQCGALVAAAHVVGIWVVDRGWLDGLLGFTLAPRPTVDVLLCGLVLGCCWAVAAGTGRLSWVDDARPVRRRVGGKIIRTAEGATASTPEADLGIGAGVRLRRLGLLAVAVAVGAAIVPTLLAARDGRWGAPELDLTRSLALVDDRGVGSAYRVLWVGQPEVLPNASRPLEGGALPPQFDGVHISTSVGGFPDVRSAWLVAPTEADHQLAEAVRAGLGGETLRMGRLLAAFGVRYVVMIERSGPMFADGYDRPVANSLRDALASQVDLRPVAADPAVRLFRNEAWWPTRAQFDPPLAAGFALNPVDLVVTDLTRGAGVLNDRRSPTRAEGSLGRGQLLVTEQFAEGWQLELQPAQAQPAAGQAPPAQLVGAQPALGWAMSFDVPTDGPAALTYQRQGRQTADLWAQLLMVLAVAWVAIGMPVPYVGALARPRLDAGAP